MRRDGLMVWVVVFLMLTAGAVIGGEPPARFPRPDFEGGYVPPATQCPAPRSDFMKWADVGILAGAMALTAWMVLRRRSRAGIVAVTVFSIVYFGFTRKGCVCSVGAIQNVVLGLSGAGYGVPLPVLLFFLLPLGFALFFGRVFCASVCPLGAIQDVVLRKPVRVPGVLAGALGFLPVLLLALSLLLTAGGAGFLVCMHDPFVGFYRLGGPVSMIASGMILLVLGIFIGRPYCRFLCPYGVLLGWASVLAGRHARITPEKCVNCRLCERACPFESIQASTSERLPEQSSLIRRRLARGVASMPLLVVAGVLAGVAVHGALSRLHPVVRLAERVAMEDCGLVKGYTLESEAFRGMGQSTAQLRNEADEVRRFFRNGSMWAGAFLGLVLGWRAIALSRVGVRREYEIDQRTCFSCGRCFEFCPVDKVWREGGTMPEELRRQSGALPGKS